MNRLFLILALCLSFYAHADQRMETWQGLCHFSADANNSDNEVYFSNCLNTIDVRDGVAFGSSVVTSGEYSLTTDTMPRLLMGGKFRGPTAFDYVDMGYVVTNTQCVMVTSNYNAGADDNNETVYVTGDWNLEIEMSTVSIDLTTKLTYHLNCRGGVQQ